MLVEEWVPGPRLTPLDAAFLELESPSAHMHIGWVAVLDPPAEGENPSFEQLRDHVGRRLARAPRFRQRLAAAPGNLVRPTWVDDERFELDRHVRPSDDRRLSDLADRVLSLPLSRDRPLWELWMADRLEDGRIGLVGKTHHCMADGIAAVALGALIPGPKEQLYVLGCPVREVFPAVPLPDRHSLSVGLLTVNGRACFGIYTDPKALPDADRLAADIGHELGRLLAYAPRRRAPRSAGTRLATGPAPAAWLSHPTNEDLARTERACWLRSTP